MERRAPIDDCRSLGSLVCLAVILPRHLVVPLTRKIRTLGDDATSSIQHLDGSGALPGFREEREEQVLGRRRPQEAQVQGLEKGLLYPKMECHNGQAMQGPSKNTKSRLCSGSNQWPFTNELYVDLVLSQNSREQPGSSSWSFDGGSNAF